MIQLSVIILNYKVPFYLMQCLSSVEKALQSISSEIIVVDNHSQDQSCDWVKQYFPKVRLLQQQENGGFSKGNNVGVKIANGKYICLLNPDTVVSETVFEKLLNFAESRNDLGAVGPQLIDGTGDFLPESKRNLPTPKVALQKLMKLEKNYYSSLKQEETGKVAVLVGAFMLMKKDRYEAIGGLDEDYFMYGEDIDLSYKFLKAGYQNYYIGSEKVLHYKGESTLKDEKYRKRFYGAMKIFYKKHFQKTSLLNPAITMALNLAKFFHRVKSEPRSLPKYQKVYWVSEQEIPKTLQQKINSEIIKISSAEMKNNMVENSKLIFDTETVDYQDIFSIMENLKIKQNYFRIKALNFNFIVESDQSTSQGSILEF